MPRRPRQQPVQPLPSPRSPAERKRTPNGRFTKDGMAQERATRGMRLWIQGATWQEIADQCGYADRSTAYKEVNRVARRAYHGTTEGYRRKQNARLEHLMAYLEQQIFGDGFVDEARLKAVGQYKGLLERQAKLNGFDIEVEGGDGFVAPIIREYPEGVEQAV